MQRYTGTSVIYALPAMACSVFMVARNLAGETAGYGFSFVLSLAFGSPLLFAFAYSRFVFADVAPKTRAKYAVALNSVGVVATTVLFSRLATPFWNNPVLQFGESISYVIAVLAVLVLFLVAAGFLLVKGRSGLTLPASILFWPYWFLLALVFVGRWFQDSSIHAAYHFLCFSAPVLFAFAAGTLFCRPTAAHASTFFGLVAVPWLYWELIRGDGYWNVWLTFNIPNNVERFYGRVVYLYAFAAISAIGFVALAVATAITRLLPSHWKFRKSPLRDRTWPAFAVSLILLATWFCRSILPYRIPGAVDYRDYPVLQILHVEKRGLQFHEHCVSVYWQRPYRPISVSFSDDDRRLLHYRFQERSASGPEQVPGSISERVKEILDHRAYGKPQWDSVKPVWRWNADNWYFFATGTGLRVYRTASGSAPPQEIVTLFQELETLPRSPGTESELRDVCLGFCYDARSAMGSLYSNHRCFNDGHGVVCR